MKITALKITPVAMHDQPLLNSTGIHESYRTRTIVQLETDIGIKGIGETVGDQTAVIGANRDWVIGHDPASINQARLNFKGSPTAWSGLEFAMLDAAARQAELPLCDYLGGRVRDAVEWSAYLFYKFADENGQGEVATGDALDPAGFVRQAEEFVNKYGFKELKIKGGFFHPDVDIETFRLLRQRFPKEEGFEIRIDPNAVWTVETAMRVAKEIEPYEPQYLEDPCDTIEQHAKLKESTDIPMASNMAVSAFTTFPPNVKFSGIDIVLGELHNRGGFLAFKEFAMLCRVFGWGFGGHSNNALGISQAAMVHACAITPELAFAADTHYPWTDTDGDIIKGGKLQFHDGLMDVPDGPGLGVEIDEDALAERREQLLTGTCLDRQEMVRSIDPGASVPGAKPPITNFPRYSKPRW